jgi:hypothetical protein
MEIENLAPGWYPDPNKLAEKRWWDGNQWTEHIHPPRPASATAASQPKRIVYWSNLFRFRFWWFTLMGSLVLSFLVGLLLPQLFVITFFVFAAVSAFFWIGVQMVCHRCGKTLATTRVAGQPEVCSKCGAVTDAGGQTHVDPK